MEYVPAVDPLAAKDDAGSIIADDLPWRGLIL
jgi:hypothetical protein